MNVESYIMYAFGGRLGPRGALELLFFVVVVWGIAEGFELSVAGLTVAKVD